MFPASQALPRAAFAAAALLYSMRAAADENLFGYVYGAEPTPKGHDDPSLHLIEKTKYELRLKVGYNF